MVARADIARRACARVDVGDRVVELKAGQPRVARRLTADARARVVGTAGGVEFASRGARSSSTVDWRAVKRELMETDALVGQLSNLTRKDSVSHRRY